MNVHAYLGRSAACVSGNVYTHVHDPRRECNAMRVCGYNVYTHAHHPRSIKMATVQMAVQCGSAVNLQQDR